MKVLELFAGLGACSKALERLGIEHEIVDAVEIDKYAIASFNAIHGTNFETQDITTWDKDIEVDLIMHGSPCQDFSVAGKQAGGDVGSGTRSSLMYETIRIVGKLRPKYVVWENVKNLLSEKHRHNFDAYLETMKALGYTNYYQVLNAKDYGVPQNRERVFTISIKNDNRNGFEFPKKQQLTKIPLQFIETNVDEKYDLTEKNKLHYQREFGSKGKEINLYEPIPTLTAAMGSGGGNIPYFEFPPKQELKIRLKDILDDVVEEKFYLNNAQINKIQNSNFAQEAKRIQEKNVCDTLLARDYKDPKCVRIGGIFDTEKSKHQAGSIWDKEGLSPTLDTMQGGWRQPSIIKYEIPQTVKVRKYPVNTEKLVAMLREQKHKLGLHNSVIGLKLDIPTTKVEHWFRQDSSFAIPDSELWFELKKILQIETEEFDESIMTFEEREGVFEKSNRCYHEQGISPTITSASADEKVITDYRIRKLTPKECWRLMGFDDEDFEKASKVCSNSQLYKQAGNSIVVNVLEEIFRNLFTKEE